MPGMPEGLPEALNGDVTESMMATLDDRIRDVERRLAEAEQEHEAARDKWQGADPYATKESREREGRLVEEGAATVRALRQQLYLLEEERCPLDGDIREAERELRGAKESLRWAWKKLQGGDPYATAASRERERKDCDDCQNEVYKAERRLEALREKQRVAKLGPRVSGVVKFFDSAKGFGFISCADGREAFVHQSAVETPPLQKGDRVDLNFGRGKKGPQAYNVRKPGLLP
jgi:CspA family cold shock protein